MNEEKSWHHPAPPFSFVQLGLIAHQVDGNATPTVIDLGRTAIECKSMLIFQQLQFPIAQLFKQGTQPHVPSQSL